eukprot:2833467-Rhodomonas_salina.3
MRCSGLVLKLRIALRHTPYCSAQCSVLILRIVIRDPQYWHKLAPICVCHASARGTGMRRFGGLKRGKRKCPVLKSAVLVAHSAETAGCGRGWSGSETRRRTRVKRCGIAIANRRNARSRDPPHLHRNTRNDVPPSATMAACLYHACGCLYGFAVYSRQYSWCCTSPVLSYGRGTARH